MRKRTNNLAYAIVGSTTLLCLHNVGIIDVGALVGGDFSVFGFSASILGLTAVFFLSSLRDWLAGKPE